MFLGDWFLSELKLTKIESF